MKPFLSLLVILWSSAFRWIYLSFSPLPLASLLLELLFIKHLLCAKYCLKHSGYSRKKKKKDKKSPYCLLKFKFSEVKESAYVAMGMDD